MYVYGSLVSLTTPLPQRCLGSVLTSNQISSNQNPPLNESMATPWAISTGALKLMAIKRAFWRPLFLFYLHKPLVDLSVKHELREAGDCTHSQRVVFNLKSSYHRLARMPNHKLSHQWLWQVQGIGTSNSFPTIMMGNGIGALGCWAVLRIAINVRYSHFHILRIGAHLRLSFSKGCLACWCPCLAHAQNRRRLDYLNINGVPDPNRNQITDKDSLLYAILEVACDMGWILQVSLLVFFNHFLTTGWNFFLLDWDPNEHSGTIQH